MDQPEQATEQNGMQLRVAFVHYLVCLAILTVFVIAAGTINYQVVSSIALFAYLGCGFYLNRNVLRNLVEWHPMYDTLDNVANAKLGFFLFWPIKYLMLFIRLSINKAI